MDYNERVIRIRCVRDWVRMDLVRCRDGLIGCEYRGDIEGFGMCREGG